MTKAKVKNLILPRLLNLVRIIHGNTWSGPYLRLLAEYGDQKCDLVDERLAHVADHELIRWLARGTVPAYCPLQEGDLELMISIVAYIRAPLHAIKKLEMFDALTRIYP